MESKRIIIRPSVFDDCRIFFEWEKQDYIREFLTIEDDRSYEDVVREFILRETDDTKQQFTLIDRESGRSFGRLYLSKINREENSVDITRIYIGDRSFLGKGYGREAMEAVLEYCFIELAMERVTLDHYTGNDVAAAMYLSLGFTYEGVMFHAAKKNGCYYDLHLMSLLRNVYMSGFNSK